MVNVDVHKVGRLIYKLVGTFTYRHSRLSVWYFIYLCSITLSCLFHDTNRSTAAYLLRPSILLTTSLCQRYGLNSHGEPGAFFESFFLILHS